MTGRLGRGNAIAAIIVAVALVACGSSGSKGAAPGTATSAPKHTAGLGQGVTANEIKIGVALVDFNCIKPYVDGLRFNQDKVYQAFFDDVNQHGGVNGRKLVPVYKTYCPIQSAPAIALCTTFTEDENVFAVIGTFVDMSGDAQECITKKHKRILLTYVVSKQIIDAAPPGLLISPAITPERRADIVMQLLKRENTLAGKKVAILGETVTQARVHSVLEPGIKALGVQTGPTAILSISGTDTAAAQTQLNSFIERWKRDGVNALFMSGDQVSHSQFIEKVRAAIPDMVLVSDTDAFVGYGQDEKVAGKNPNPYEGALTAEGETGIQHDKSDEWKKCAQIYQDHTGKVAPASDKPPQLADGKYDDTHGTIGDACATITMLAAILTRVGPDVNNDNWTQAVNNFGVISDPDVPYASLHTGKYDADDTFGLAAFDSSIPPKGDVRAVTPVVNVANNP